MELVELHTGDALRLIIPVREGDGYRDPTGDDLAYEIRDESHGTSTTYIELTDADDALTVEAKADVNAEGGLDHVPDGTNVVVVELTDTETDDLPGGVHYHELHVAGTTIVPEASGAESKIRVRS